MYSHTRVITQQCANDAREAYNHINHSIPNLFPRNLITNLTLQFFFNTHYGGGLKFYDELYLLLSF